MLRNSKTYDSCGTAAVFPMKYSLRVWGMTVIATALWGGSYRDRPEGMFGVSMVKVTENPAEADVRVATRDFGVPNVRDVADAANLVIAAMQEGREVFVGCGYGLGRTGLMLGVLAKIAGEDDPVGYVRMVYRERAIETPDQEKFVEQFPETEIRWIRRRAGFRALLKLLRL